MFGPTHRLPPQLVAALAAVLTVVVAAVPAHAQTSSSAPEIKIDSPRADATITNGSPLAVGGWAIDPAGPGTGIEEVRVYLDGEMDRGGRLLGIATYPKPRPDVAAARGNPAFVNSGYDYVWTPRGLTPGPHRLYVYARSTSKGWSWQSVNISGPSQGVGIQSGGYGPRSAGMMAQYGGGHLGGAGYGPPLCGLPSSYLDPRCPPPPPPPPPRIPPYYPPVVTPPTVPLAAPTGVVPVGITGTTVGLQWVAVPGAATYRVLVAVGSSGIYGQANLANLTATGAVVTGLLPNTLYMFQVVAVDALGNQGLPSTAIPVTTTPGP
jgi:hypothetical protein